MITLEDVMEWLKTLFKAEHYYCGTLPNKKERSLGVYQLKDSRARDIAIGGEKNTKTLTKGVSLLLHWEQSTRTTERAANELFSALTHQRGAVIGGHNVDYIALTNAEPIDVGTDESGVCERVIEFIIYYRKGEE